MYTGSIHAHVCHPLFCPSLTLISPHGSASITSTFTSYIPNWLYVSVWEPGTTNPRKQVSCWDGLICSLVISSCIHLLSMPQLHFSLGMNNVCSFYITHFLVHYYVVGHLGWFYNLALLNTNMISPFLNSSKLLNIWLTCYPFKSPVSPCLYSLSIPRDLRTTFYALYMHAKFTYSPLVSLSL